MSLISTFSPWMETGPRSKITHRHRILLATSPFQQHKAIKLLKVFWRLDTIKTAFNDESVLPASCFLRLKAVRFLGGVFAASENTRREIRIMCLNNVCIMKEGGIILGVTPGKGIISLSGLLLLLERKKLP